MERTSLQVGRQAKGKTTFDIALGDAVADGVVRRALAAAV